jgi:hypothetical protein
VLGILIKAYGALVSILTAIPLTCTVKVWASDRMVAELDMACGSRETGVEIGLQFVDGVQHADLGVVRHDLAWHAANVTQATLA